jgi:hypothetical protein
LKILFVVDNSGSTANTDPSNQYRILAVQNLIAKYGANPNFQYGYSYFSGTDGSTAAYGTWDFDTKTNSFFSFQVTSNSSNTSVNYADSVVPSLKSYSPFGNVSSLQSALSAFENLGAGGHTPYKAAFAAISNIVMQDLATASDPKGTSYAVVFMSDGGPSDLAVQQDSDFSQVISKNVSELQTIVQDLRSSVGAKGSSITVSSVYFGPESGADGGIANIQAIANTGGGQFVDTNVTQQLDFSSLISYSGTGCN